MSSNRMSYTEFVNQVYNFMRKQQLQKESLNINTTYKWLGNKKIKKLILTARDDYRLFKSFENVKEEQKTQVFRQLLQWLNDNPNESAEKIPEICVNLLNNFHTTNIINNVNLQRSYSLRNSFRQLSNRIVTSSFRSSSKPTVYTIPN